VVLRVNLGFGRGGVTNPPRYVAALSFGPWAAARSLVASERARITEHVQKNPGFIWNSPKLMSMRRRDLRQHNDLSHHPHIIV
jgi:hypothetical protein